MATLCGLFGKKRQWYYANMKADVSERQRVKLLADMIGYYRLCCPRIGGFKLFHLLEKDLGHAVTLGRDSFLKVYESKGFKLNPNKRRRTTDSNHVYKRYPNLIKGKTRGIPTIYGCRTSRTCGYWGTCCTCILSPTPIRTPYWAGAYPTVSAPRIRQRPCAWRSGSPEAATFAVPYTTRTGGHNTPARLTSAASWSITYG